VCAHPQGTLPPSYAYFLDLTKPLPLIADIFYGQALGGEIISALIIFCISTGRCNMLGSFMRLQYYSYDILWQDCCRKWSRLIAQICLCVVITDCWHSICFHYVCVAPCHVNILRIFWHIKYFVHSLMLLFCYAFILYCVSFSNNVIIMCAHCHWCIVLHKLQLCFRNNFLILTSLILLIIHKSRLLNALIIAADLQKLTTYTRVV